MNDTESVPEDDAAIGIAFRKSLVVIAIVVAIVCGTLFAVQRMSSVQQEVIREVTLPTPREEVPAPVLPMTEVAGASGLSFEHFSGATGEKLLPETMGSGCAFFDYDNDGDQDIFLVNGTSWPWSQGDDQPQPTSKLFQNDGAGNYTDVTDQTGAGVVTYGMGVAVGDINNDGWRDVFISGVGTTEGDSTTGPHRLLINNNGTFTEQSATAGVRGASDAWGTSCGMIDYDNDGLLDLFICNYVLWSRKLDRQQGFKLDGNERGYGPPRAFRGTYPTLYHNNGDGTFSDVSEQAGVQVQNRETGVPLAKGMGVAPVDVNDDGWIDLIVANDTVRNLLFINQKDGTFIETGELTAIAYSRDGKPRGAMGIDVARIRDNGTLAVCIGNFANEMSALFTYRADRNQFFDAAIATGLGPPTRKGLTFGMLFCDVDLDGRFDIIGANGHLEQEISRIQRTQRYRQPMQLFWNAGPLAKSEFVHVLAESTGESFVEPIVGRAATLADIDLDGDQDILVTTNGGAVRLYRNDQQLENHWVRLKLIGTKSNRDAIGAKVTVTVGEKHLYGQVNPTRSYLSQAELPIVFGLGTAEAVDAIEIRWPSGIVQTVEDIAIDDLTEITEPTQ